MPYPNEMSCRLLDPNGFQPDSFRRVTRDHNGKEYSVIMGKLKGKDSMTEQAYRYSKKIWSESDARKHCENHSGNFEPARDNKQASGIDSLMERADHLLQKHILRK